VFEWIDGENIETDDTKTSEYQMLSIIYPLTKKGFSPSFEQKRKNHEIPRKKLPQS
jgi:hypothetical protein